MHKNFLQWLLMYVNNLANNNEFIQCFEESPKDALLDIVASLEDGEPSSDDTVRISIYTQGLLNETIGFGLDLNLADNTELSINIEYNERNRRFIHSKLYSRR